MLALSGTSDAAKMAVILFYLGTWMNSNDTRIKSREGSAGSVVIDCGNVCYCFLFD